MRKLQIEAKEYSGSIKPCCFQKGTPSPASPKGNLSQSTPVLELKTADSPLRVPKPWKSSSEDRPTHPRPQVLPPRLCVCVPISPTRVDQASDPLLYSSVFHCHFFYSTTCPPIYNANPRLMAPPRSVTGHFSDFLQKKKKFWLSEKKFRT